MNVEALFLFLILLLGLVLCSFLGGNCHREGLANGSDTSSGTGSGSGADTSGASTGSTTSYDNYNHYNGEKTKLLNGSTYYGPNGSTAKVETGSDGKQRLVMYMPGSTDKILMTQINKIESAVPSRENFEQNEDIVFKDSAGQYVARLSTKGGVQGIEFTTPNGTYFYSSTPTNTSTQYFGSTGSQIQTSQGASAYESYQPYGSGSSSALPAGIPRSQIPAGQEDLYILKSEVVPPVCPVCPPATTVPRQEQCPPCPACARCPESPFECKKVPNYNAMNGGSSNSLPIPVLSDFSQFGM